MTQKGTRTLAYAEVPASRRVQKMRMLRQEIGRAYREKHHLPSSLAAVKDLLELEEAVLGVIAAAAAALMMPRWAA
jgi:hypothetical protein